ncbi:RNA polymerase sigma factor [Streptomyces sp. ISL-11]|uniref:RNA polymerase sigma factor n=1 Tax=Streptomyces sp. ISL-11 TaxID=2819174 RepID=UPI001BEB06A3|nr:sigma-70 family RNA polymerase sigma factor [Streptomyces sp. ISL-11]MBT2383970.1 sigma-70 family RNA polymerase sigma factor [Streptomyces sp. ISL-11]
MTGDWERLPPAGTRRRRLAVTFVAFHELHAAKWGAYARVRTGDREAAERIVAEVFARLRPCWPHVLRQPSAESCAWSLLREHLDRHPVDRGTAAHPLREEHPWRSGPPEEEMELCAAVARLPERQRDALVLHFVIGYTVGQVAELLGVEEATARSHIGHARRALAAVPAARHRGRATPCQVPAAPAVESSPAGV